MNDSLIHYLPLEEWSERDTWIVVRCGKFIHIGPEAELHPPTDFTHIKSDVTCPSCMAGDILVILKEFKPTDERV